MHNVLLTCVNRGLAQPTQMTRTEAPGMSQKLLEHLEAAEAQLEQPQGKSIGGPTNPDKKRARDQSQELASQHIVCAGWRL